MGYDSLNCDSCQQPLELSGHSFRGRPEKENELYIAITGGYGGFIDTLGWPDTTNGFYQYVVCHDCAMKIAALFKEVMNNHHHSLVPCSCPEYLETKRRFDEGIELQAKDWADHKEGHPTGRTDCMFCSDNGGE